MNDTAPGDSHFVAYEYRTIRVPVGRESLFSDSFGNFGWLLESTGTSLPGTPTVTLAFKRDRGIKNRVLVTELQSRSEAALTTITALERSSTRAALMISLTAGILGCAFLAGSVFTLQAGLLLVSIPLGVIGLAGWLAGFLSHSRVLAHRTRHAAPLIEEQYTLLALSGEQASHLLS
ncbi:hypothetical protein BJQ94_14580 [Cryobacterium sp. SO2]|uniref:hypothetical protein n=1 Tax=Cryobacterium sp. SO2 TaxID=1897060 RepID=UPI00223DAF78|nr:hypothetical protein [Cryobacterium sp. SO2]WEO76578.1 hypothetical protein BJQ94_14580 [Cryobacterium sp. SO2]